jgi:hypothetical protein
MTTTKTLVLRVTESQYDALMIACEKFSVEMSNCPTTDRNDMNWHKGMKRSIDHISTKLGAAWWNLEADVFPNCECAHHDAGDEDCLHTEPTRSSTKETPDA